MRHSIINLTAAFCLMTAGTAQAAGEFGALANYMEPADSLAYVQPKGSFRPSRCAPGGFEIRAFRHNGEALAGPVVIAGRDAIKWSDGKGGVVVWNGPTRRFRNYTTEPIITAAWCARQAS